MSNQFQGADGIRASLFYKSTCPPCQWMSKLAVIMSLGSIRRLPIAGDEAKKLYEHYPGHEGQLILINGGVTTFGRLVFMEVPRCILSAWWRMLCSMITIGR